MPYLIGLTGFKTAVSIARGENWLFDQKINNGEYKIPTIITPIMTIDKYNLVTVEDRWKKRNIKW
ncbi:hypothetical protein [Halothermothrix orenii]|uniref:Uncharacterized protein n=1 Tax=Halothermothrix orenii (strain H 168 / OCM 544 / DSM 9562) TaxID=373903 RepID=B8CZP1_HALOH|nr:hypothetical protein [Halothermothrix orenii]ACL68771.1 hypothetical protein Hore_00080 [Halothermothrix orenii H 168]